jgi:hypothetical protein
MKAMHVTIGFYINRRGARHGFYVCRGKRFRPGSVALLGNSATMAYPMWSLRQLVATFLGTGAETFRSGYLRGSSYTFRITPRSNGRFAVSVIDPFSVVIRDTKTGARANACTRAFFAITDNRLMDGDRFSAVLVR